MPASLQATPRRDLPPILLGFLSLLVLLAAICFTSYWVSGHLLHLGDPYSSILLPLHGVDLVGYHTLWPRIHQFAFFTDKSWPIYRYPAPAFFIYAIFFYGPHYYRVFNVTLIAILIVADTLLIAAIARRGIALWQAAAFVILSTLCCYPIFFEFRQDNIEPFILLFIATSIWCMLRGHDNAAAILLGIAGAMKIYPFIFLGLYLLNKRFGPVLLAALVGIVTTVLGLRFLTPSILFSWHGVGDGLANYNQEFAHNIGIAFGYDHSVFTLVKALVFFVPFLHHRLPTLLNLYYLAAAVTGTTLFFTRIRKLPFVNQVFALVLAETFLPPSTYDYTLIHLFLPTTMLILLAVEQRGSLVPGLRAMFLSLALILGFMTELIFHGQRFAGCVKATIFLVLFALVLRYPLHGTWPENPIRRPQPA